MLVGLKVMLFKVVPVSHVQMKTSSTCAGPLMSLLLQTNHEPSRDAHVIGTKTIFASV